MSKFWKDELSETLKKIGVDPEDAIARISKYSGKIVTVKVGGELLDNQPAALSFIEDLLLLKHAGIKVVLCHGGGPQISRHMKAMGKTPEFKDGLRVTDGETIELTTMVLLGVLNAKLVALSNRKGPNAVGISGADGALFQVEQENPELGFVGRIKAIRSELVSTLLERDYIPVVAPLGIGSQGALYNINADLAAGNLASALKAEKFIVVTNVEGLYRNYPDKSSIISESSLPLIQEMLKSGTIVEGMIPKLEGIVEALSGGVGQAQLVDGRVPHSVLLNAFAGEPGGTVINR